MKKAYENKYFFEEKIFDQIKNTMNKYNKEINHNGKQFGEMIIKALGLGSGHWYTCPNGHPYAIGDCG